MRRSLSFGAVAVFLFTVIFGGLQTAEAQVAPGSIFRGVWKQTLQADSSDVQAVKLVIPHGNPSDITTVSLRVNFGHAVSPERGNFRWTSANGFSERGDSIATGNAFVTLLPVNPSNPTAGSQYYVNQKAGTATFIFRWTADPTYGDVADNDIEYAYAAPAQNVASGWQFVDTSFVVDANGYVHSAFVDLGEPKSSVMADGQDVQIVKLVIQTAHPDAITDVRIRVNAEGPNAPQGYFAWRPSGFYERPGSNWGNEQVTLLTSGPDASYRLVTTDSELGPIVAYYFRWTIDPAVGATTGNTIRYSWAEMQYRPSGTGDATETFATVLPVPALHVAQMPQAVETYAPGDHDVTLTTILLDANGSSEDVRVTGFEIDPSAAAALLPMNLENIRFLVDRDGDSYDGVGVQEALWPAWSGYFTFDLADQDEFIVEAGKKLLVTVVADIGGQGSSGVYTILPGLLRDGFAVGAASGANVHETIDTTTPGELVVLVAPPQPSTLTVSLDSSSPSASQFAGGTQGVTLATFNFYTDGPEDVEVDLIKVAQRTPTGVYADYRDYNLLYLVDEHGVTVGSVVPVEDIPTIDIHDGAFIVEHDDVDGAALHLKANLADIAPALAVPVGGHALGFEILAPFMVSAEGDQSGTAAMVSFGSNAPIGAVHYLYKGIPTFERLSLPMSTLTNGFNTLFRFRLVANTDDISVRKFTFEVVPFGVTLTNLELVDVTHDSSEAVLYSDSGIAPLNPEVMLGSERVIAASQSRTFELRGLVAGAQPGDAISTRMAGDAEPVVGATAPMMSSVEVDGASENDFIWSDRHASAHGLATSDWTNGYLVRGLSSPYTAVSVLSL